MVPRHFVFFSILEYRVSYETTLYKRQGQRAREVSEVELTVEITWAHMYRALVQTFRHVAPQLGFDVETKLSDRSFSPMVQPPAFKRTCDSRPSLRVPVFVFIFYSAFWFKGQNLNLNP